jgi:hypothetical protein
MKITQLCAAVAVMAVASSAPVHTQTLPDAPPDTFHDALEATFRALPSPLVCESHGVAYEGRTARTWPATRESREGGDFEDAEDDAGEALAGIRHWASEKKLRCAENCALSFYAFPRFALGAAPVKQDPNYVQWDVYYACKRPPPEMINQTIVPGGGGATAGGGGASGGGSASGGASPEAGSGTSATEDLCKKRQKKIDAIEAEDEKAERAQRDIQSQIEAAISRGEEPSQDLIQQANAIRSQRANNATWIKVLEKCEDPSLLNSPFGDISIGIGVGGGHGHGQHGGQNNTQPSPPNNQQPGNH